MEGKLTKQQVDLIKEFPETEKIFQEKNGQIVLLCKDEKDFFTVSSDGDYSLVKYFESDEEYEACYQLLAEDKLIDEMMEWLEYIGG